MTSVAARLSRTDDRGARENNAPDVPELLSTAIARLCSSCFVSGSAMFLTAAGDGCVLVIAGTGDSWTELEVSFLSPRGSAIATKVPLGYVFPFKTFTKLAQPQRPH